MDAPTERSKTEDVLFPGVRSVDGPTERSKTLDVRRLLGVRSPMLGPTVEDGPTERSKTFDVRRLAGVRTLFAGGGRGGAAPDGPVDRSKTLEDRRFGVERDGLGFAGVPPLVGVTERNSGVVERKASGMDGRGGVAYLVEAAREDLSGVREERRTVPDTARGVGRNVEGRAGVLGAARTGVLGADGARFTDVEGTAAVKGASLAGGRKSPARGGHVK